jgi:hypothetical protein
MPAHAFLPPDSRANLETGPHRRHDGEFYRECRTAAQARKKPVRAGASPAGSEQQRHGGRRERGRRWATPAAVRRGPDDLPHTRHDERRCGRGRGSSTPARKRVTKVDRQGVAAGDCSPVTASASRLAERGLRSARSRCPTSSRSALARVQQTSAPPSAGEQRQRLRHRGGCITPSAAVSSRLPQRRQSSSVSTSPDTGEVSAIAGPTQASIWTTPLGRYRKSAAGYAGACFPLVASVRPATPPLDQSTSARSTRMSAQRAAESTRYQRCSNSRARPLLLGAKGAWVPKGWP